MTEEEPLDLAKATEVIENMAAWAFRIREQMLELDSILARLNVGSLRQLAEKHAMKCSGCHACEGRLAWTHPAPRQAPVIQQELKQAEINLSSGDEPYVGWSWASTKRVHFWCKSCPVGQTDDLIPVSRDAALQHNIKCGVCHRSLAVRIDSITVEPAKPWTAGTTIHVQPRPIKDNPQA